MKRYFYLACGILPLLFSITYKFYKKNSVKTELYESGRVHFEYPLTNGYVDGLVTEYYEYGNIKSECYYVNNVKHGSFLTFFEDGRIKTSSHFVNGVREDTMKVNFNNGVVQEISVWRKGKLNGEFKSFDEFGTLEIIGNFENDKKSGQWQVENGGIQAEEYYYFDTLTATFSKNTYTHRNNYAITLPKSWTKNFEDASKVGFVNHDIIDGSLPQSITIATMEVSDELSVEEYISREMIGNKRLIDSIKVHAQSFFDQGASHVGRVLYSGKLNKRKKAIIVVLYVLKRKNLIYVVSCLTPLKLFDDQSRKMFMSIFDILSFREQPLAAATSTNLMQRRNYDLVDDK